MSEVGVDDKPSKKLKQACLPFKQVNSPGDDSNSKCRKRKLSGTENDETRVENPKVELLNGGTKCFIKSDENDEKESEKQPKEIVIVDDSSSSEKSYVNCNEVIEVKDSLESTKNYVIIDEENEKISDLKSPDSYQKNKSLNITPESSKTTVTTPGSKKLTPKQLAKKLESTKKQEERLKLKEEKERAREEKLKEQQEKLRLKQWEKEQKKQAEAEAKRQRDLEKENEKKQKEEEKKAKELEKKKKEEERKAKELEKEREKKQKEDERKAKELEKEEKLLKEKMEKEKSEKVKAAFVGFFKPKNSNSSSIKKEFENSVQDENYYFMPFQTKPDMRIAPTCRSVIDAKRKQALDKYLSQSENLSEKLYLQLLKNGNYISCKSESTWPYSSENDADVVIIETGENQEAEINSVELTKNAKSRFRWKLLQFTENKRPPYWGTWRKKSLYVKPRKPFSCDKIMFDYEVDSDDEWEEEDPGESLHGSDDEKESEDDYEVDNDLFVPHGYLSDEEGQDNDDTTEEAQQEKLKMLGKEFEAEIKKKTERIKPRLVGCVWIPNNVTNPENVSKSVADTLLKYRSVWGDEEPIITRAPIVEDSPKHLNTSSEVKKKMLLPDSIIPNLIKHVHGNSIGLKLLANQFMEELSKTQTDIDENFISIPIIRRSIKEIAKKSSNSGPW
ncbi:chromatin assembly factor 1 subunit A-B-like isoform X2 [Daktulosphaira vitifoliae]|nr:chromatin assembly factor 1 subunit A-B-like isoform X2 [Daktulosphaira vitifoliae]